MSRQKDEALLALCVCALKGAAPEGEAVAAMDLDAVLDFAAFHKLSALCAWALERGGFGNARTRGLLLSAQRRALIFRHAMEQLRPRLEAAGIWYLPLKGAVLQELYPQLGLREMVDYDVLFDASRAGDVRAIMEELGFATEQFGAGQHDIYHKPPCLNFELHRSLFAPYHPEKLYAYYRDPEGRLLGEGCEKHFSPEDFYLYTLAHAYKHYAGGGTGLRFLLDTWLCLKAKALDLDYVAAEAEKLGIRDFEAQSRCLALKLFSGEALEDAERELLDYLLASGALGTTEHAVDARLHESGGSLPRYVRERFRGLRRKLETGGDSSAAALLRRVLRAAKSGRLQAELRALRSARRRDKSNQGPG